MATPTTLPATFVDGNVLTAAEMNNLRGAFRVLQIANATKTDTFTTSSTTFTDLTGLSVSITPSSTSSKILVFSNLTGTAGGVLAFFQIVRDTTAIGIGDTRGSRSRIGATLEQQASGSTAFATSLSVFDSPASTSALTYKIQARAQVAGTVYINRSVTDTDNSNYWTSASAITVMEISA